MDTRSYKNHHFMQALDEILAFLHKFYFFPRSPTTSSSTRGQAAAYWQQGRRCLQTGLLEGEPPPAPGIPHLKNRIREALLPLGPTAGGPAGMLA